MRIWLYCSCVCISVAPIKGAKIEKSLYEVHRSLEALASATTQIHRIIREEPPQKLSQLLQKYPAVANYADANGKTPLQTASRALQSTEKVKRLLDFGADPNRGEGDKPLLNAISEYDIETLRLLLKHGANPNVDDGDQTAIKRATIALDREKEYQMIKLLLQYGANPDVAQGFTGPVIFYATENNIPLLRLLLEYHANPNLQKVTPPIAYITVLHTLAGKFMELKNEDIQAAHMLLEYGADPNVQDEKGDTPLHYLARFRNPAALRQPIKEYLEQRDKLIELLGVFGANPYIKNNENESPLSLSYKRAPIIYSKVLENTWNKSAEEIVQTLANGVSFGIMLHTLFLIGQNRYYAAYEIITKYKRDLEKTDAQRLLIHTHAMHTRSHTHAMHTRSTDTSPKRGNIIQELSTVMFDNTRLIDTVIDQMISEPTWLENYPIEAPVLSSILQWHKEAIQPRQQELKQAIPTHLTTHKELLEISFPKQPVDDLMLKYMRDIQNKKIAPAVMAHIIDVYPYQVGTYHFPENTQPQYASGNSMLHAIAYAPALAHLVPSVAKHVFTYTQEGQPIHNNKGQTPTDTARLQDNTEFMFYTERFYALRNHIEKLAKQEDEKFPRARVWEMLEETAQERTQNPHAPFPFGVKA